MNEIHDIENLTPEIVENLYNDILEGPERILIAKCASGCVYNSNFGKCCRDYGYRCENSVNCNI